MTPQMKNDYFIIDMDEADRLFQASVVTRTVIAVAFFSGLLIGLAVGVVL